MFERGSAHMLEHQVNAVSAGELASCLCHLRAWLDDSIGTDTAQFSTALRSPVDGNHAGSQCMGQLDGGKPKAAVSPKHQDRLAGSQATAAKHCCGRCVGQTETCARHPVHVPRERRSVARGNSRVLSVATVNGRPYRTKLLAEVVFALQAMRALSTRQNGRGEHALAHVPVAYLGAGRYDFTGKVGAGNA